MDFVKLQVILSTALKNRSICHGYQHALDVERFAMKLCASYSVDRQLVRLMALMHDVYDHKFDDISPFCRSQFSAWFYSNGFTEETIKAFFDELKTISWSAGQVPERLETRIVQDADRLTGIGAIGILRTITYNLEHGGDYSSVVQHMKDKLLKLKDRMNTPEAKEFAESGHRLIQDFVTQYEAEKAV